MITDIMKPGFPAPAITSDMTVNEVARAFPATLRVFHVHGIDSCCGGGLPLAVVAEKHGLDLSDLLESLNAVSAEE